MARASERGVQPKKPRAIAFKHRPRGMDDWNTFPDEAQRRALQSDIRLRGDKPKRSLSCVQLVKIRALRRAKFPYGPIRFIARRKIVASDKLLVAFDALALIEGWHKAPAIGQILHGQGQSRR